MAKKPMRLAWLAEVGGPEGEQPGAPPAWWTGEAYAEQLRMVEQAGVEFVVLGGAAARTVSPAVLTGALAARTRSIGLVPVVAMADYPPYMLARLAVSLQYVTEGRSGWAMDTAYAGRAGAAYGMQAAPDPAQHAAIAAEYLDVCQALWTGWQPGALVQDAADGIFADPARVRAPEHAGAFFRVRGPLNTVSHPGGPPLLVQVVRSGDDPGFAARHAEVVVVRAPGPAEAQATVQAIRTQAGRHGRDPAGMVLFAAVGLAVGEALPDGAPPDGDRIPVAGTADTVPGLLEEAFAATGADGVAICGDWSSLHVTTLCSEVIGTLRQRGSVAPPRTAPVLRDRVLGA